MRKCTLIELKSIIIIKRFDLSPRFIVWYNSNCVVNWMAIAQLDFMFLNEENFGENHYLSRTAFVTFEEWLETLMQYGSWKTFRLLALKPNVYDNSVQWKGKINVQLWAVHRKADDKTLQTPIQEIRLKLLGLSVKGQTLFSNHSLLNWQRSYKIMLTTPTPTI